MSTQMTDNERQLTTIGVWYDDDSYSFPLQAYSWYTVDGGGIVKYYGRL